MSAGTQVREARVGAQMPPPADVTQAPIGAQGCEQVRVEIARYVFAHNLCPNARGGRMCAREDSNAARCVRNYARRALQDYCESGCC